MFSYSCTYTFDVSFISFTVFRTISEVKEKGRFSWKFCNFKILFELEKISFFVCLKDDYSNFKADNFFFSPAHANTQILLSAYGYFYRCLKPFSGFSSQSNPHSKDLFLILRNTRFHNRFYMWIVTSLKSTIR